MIILIAKQRSMGIMEEAWDASTLDVIWNDLSSIQLNFVEIMLSVGCNYSPHLSLFPFNVSISILNFKGSNIK